MRLKVSAASKTAVISIEDESDLSVLLLKLQEESLLANAITDAKIKAGFPPKAIDLSDKTMKLLDTGIRAGDRLIIEEASIKQAPSTPETLTAPKPARPTSSTPHVKIDDGYIVLRKMPDDNSCLFRSISYGVFHNYEEGSQLRSVVADAIRQKPETYSDAILGKPREEYIKWIQKPTSWGGAIELQILSEHLGITIKSIDVENGRTDNFNEGELNFIVVFYTGIHYDAISYTPLIDIDNKEIDVSVFNGKSELGFRVLKAVQQLSKSLNHKGYVTNTSKIKIKCNVCGAQLSGEKQASHHASETGHLDFGEIN